MARYFKYKSLEELVEHAHEFGHDLATSRERGVLLQPIEIGTRTVGNRLCVQPMEGCDGTLAGVPDELTFRRYQRFGGGGAKLIWGEAVAISDAGRMNPRQLLLAEHTLPALAEMLRVCRNAHRAEVGDDGDLLVGLQLTHSGRYSCRFPQLAVHDALLDPLTIDPRTQRAISPDHPLLTNDDLQRIEDEYVRAARCVANLGYDFVDVKQCHRYLLSELLAAKTRPGPYGGSLENRTRLVRNVIGRIRHEVPGLMIATRLNVYDGVPFHGVGEEFVGVPRPHATPLATAFGVDEHHHGQWQPQEPIQVAKWLAEWGVSLINISGGNPYACPHFVRPAEFPPVDGYHAPEHPLHGVLRQLHFAATIQHAVPHVPVVGSGYSWLQDYALDVGAGQVAAGHVAFAGLGRATLSQPDFARHYAATGLLPRKTVCRTFSYCTNLMRTKDHPLGQYATGCPPFDKEVYGPLWKEAEAKRAAR